MRGLQITALIIFGCIFSTQAIRHVHVYTIGFEESILAPAESFYQMKEAVRMEESTEELLSEYETTNATIKELRKEESAVDQFALRQQHLDLFARNETLASELRQREEATREGHPGGQGQEEQ